jgi:uncharacterized protein (TIGR02217 family)
MPRRTQTYAIRLAVEGGGQVKAELISVGQSGEQSLKRIESAGERASGGLRGLGRQAELLRNGIRTLGGALAGVATVGGLTALVDRSISAADAIGKTADKIGVGVEALQELRFAAKASGVEQQTLDMALQRFTRRAAEAAQGTGEAKEALAQMGIALRDQSGNLRRSENLLADVADAFARIEDPAERMRLAFKLFDSEGVALVNLLRGGSDALEETGSGHEKRNVNWVQARGRWDVAGGLKKQAQIDELIAFFRARRGRAYGFRFKDWTDYMASGQLLGTGDDAQTQFQLVKHYPSGSVIEVRTITKPVAGTVKVYLDGVEQLSGWSVDTITGLVTFGLPPVLGVELTADFEFDMPVRFDTDHMAVTIESYRLHTWQQIPIVELRA